MRIEGESRCRAPPVHLHHPESGSRGDQGRQTKRREGKMKWTWTKKQMNATRKLDEDKDEDGGRCSSHEVTAGKNDEEECYEGGDEDGKGWSGRGGGAVGDEGEGEWGEKEGEDLSSSRQRLPSQRSPRSSRSGGRRKPSLVGRTPQPLQPRHPDTALVSARQTASPAALKTEKSGLETGYQERTKMKRDLRMK